MKGKATRANRLSLGVALKEERGGHERRSDMNSNTVYLCYILGLYRTVLEQRDGWQVRPAWGMPNQGARIKQPREKIGFQPGRISSWCDNPGAQTHLCSTRPTHRRGQEYRTAENHAGRLIQIHARERGQLVLATRM